ncbi:universal stress protein [Haloplanus aerogenes]|uniref:Universal stress protein n=1 Tax=Haloplanus aerogenes TaxID=660522 RepID=A0A3M0DRF8_9EURY|nr:universal stress protein [Haloplanus aerogenes]AZH24169.1 universal stress protein [Haloplanus aerogenes]RMB24211.1 universal stress protein family protein [Haloplanus aerogenes]
MSDAADPPDLLSRPLVPVASEEDAVDTCRAAFPRIAAVGGRPVVVHIIEKAGGAPDKASVEQRETVAEAAFDAVRDCAADHGLDVETKISYGRDVAGTIIEAADDIDASAIVFRPRGGSWLLDLLTGDVRDALVTESDRPVVVLPDADTEGGR